MLDSKNTSGASKDRIAVLIDLAWARGVIDEEIYHRIADTIDTH